MLVIMCFFNYKCHLLRIKLWYMSLSKVVVTSLLIVVVNHCFTSLFGTKGLLSDIVNEMK